MLCDNLPFSLAYRDMDIVARTGGEAGREGPRDGHEPRPRAGVPDLAAGPPQTSRRIGVDGYSVSVYSTNFVNR